MAILRNKGGILVGNLGRASTSSPLPIVAANGWWDDNGNIASCILAVQPVGADDYADSLNDLSGVTGAINFASAPSWTAGSGWTTNQASDAIAGMCPTGGFSVVWFGTLADSQTNPGFFSNSAVDFTGLNAHGWDDGAGSFYIGCNADVTPRYTAVAGGGTELSIFYTKNGSNQQNLYVDGSTVDTVDKAGSTQTTTDAIIQTSNGGSCKAVAFYNAELTSSEVSAVATALAAL